MGRHARVAELAGLAALRADAGPRPLAVADLGCGRGRTVRAVLDAVDAVDAAWREAVVDAEVGPRSALGPTPGQRGGVVVHALDQVSALPEELLADPRVRSRMADLDGALPFEDASLDAALSVNTVEHLADPLAHLAEVHRVLRPGGTLVLAHSDWDTALFTSTDDALTRTLVDRFVASARPAGPAGGNGTGDGFTGRKLLATAAASGRGGSPWTLLEVASWADPHRRFDEESIAWKVATGVLAATRGDPVLSARAAGWLDELRGIARAGQFLFTVTDVAVALRAEPTAG